MQSRQQSLESWRPEAVVGVQHEKKRLSAERNGRIPRQSDAQVSAVTHDVCSREPRSMIIQKLRSPLPTIVIRTIIDYDHPQGAEILFDNRSECFGNHLRIVKNRNYYDDFRLALRSVCKDRISELLYFG